MVACLAREFLVSRNDFISNFPELKRWQDRMRFGAAKDGEVLNVLQECCAVVDDGTEPLNVHIFPIRLEGELHSDL